jgi:hypothetical protein
MATNTTRGGTPQQHSEAGKQSHKNDGSKSGSAGSGGSQKGSGQGQVKDPQNDGRLKENR